MAVRLSALRTGRDLLSRNIISLPLILISVTGWAHPRALCGMNDYGNWTFIHPNVQAYNVVYRTVVEALSLSEHSCSHQYQKQKNASGEQSAAGAQCRQPCAIRQPTAYTMCDPQHLTALQISTACYGDSPTYFIIIIITDIIAQESFVLLHFS
jgi:hypothetical protein